VIRPVVVLKPDGTVQTARVDGYSLGVRVYEHDVETMTTPPQVYPIRTLVWTPRHALRVAVPEAMTDQEASAAIVDAVLKGANVRAAVWDPTRDPT
jgi:hypothetical protein